MEDNNVTPELSEEDEFEQAFNEFAEPEHETAIATDEPIEAEVEDETEAETEAEAEVETEAEVIAEPTTDIWANATEEQRAAMEAVRRERAEIEHRYKSDEGRVSALQRKINDLEARQQPAPVAISQAAPVSDEGIDSFREDYPDIANAVDKMVQSKMTTEREGFSQAMRQMQQQMDQAIQPFQESEQKRFIDTQMQELESSHPDWREVAQSTDFIEWLNVQPDPVRAMFTSDSARDASYLVGSFKQTQPVLQEAETVEPSSNNQQALKQAVAPRSRRTAPVTNSVPDDYESAFDYWVDQAKKG
tara:strand:- start:1775 stop:2686 length:912 start_codon:yes stop_codon:yes gene_type:complete